LIRKKWRRKKSGNTKEEAIAIHYRVLLRISKKDMGTNIGGKGVGEGVQLQRISDEREEKKRCRAWGVRIEDAGVLAREGQNDLRFRQSGEAGRWVTHQKTVLKRQKGFL